MDVNAVALEQPAEQNNLRREQPEPGRHGSRVFAQNTGRFLNDLHHAFVTLYGAFENHRRKSGDVVLVGDLRPADELVPVVQTQGAKNGGRELRFAAVEIVLAQNETERLQRDEISA